MEISRYLAMTKGEIAHFSCPDGYYPGWMACHFSPYGTGLSNFPRRLPPGSMLILNDRTPICGHDPQRIRQQLRQAAEESHCGCVLLDFQRSGEVAARNLCEILAEDFPCPVGVSDLYAEGLPCPVFLPPVPLDQTLTEHLAVWEEREIWLDMAPEALQFLITGSGSTVQPQDFLPDTEGFFDETLCCRYESAVFEDSIRFTLWRDYSALEALAQKAQELGVTKLVGLFQDYRRSSPGVQKSTLP